MGLAVGYGHAMLVDLDGRVRSWGSGSWDRLGHGSVANVAVPKLIASLATKRAVCVSVIRAHSMIVTDAGVLYSFWGE